MADNESSPKRKKLRLKTTGRMTKPGTGDGEKGAEKAASEAAADAAAEGAEETASVQDPLASRDAESVDKLKRLRPDESPSTAQALTETGRLGPPGSDTVRLKVVKDARRSPEGKSGGPSETIRLRPSSEQGESPGENAAKTEAVRSASDTLRVKPAAGSSGEDRNTHTATLRVAKHPKHESREGTAAAGEKTAGTADETQTPERMAKTGTETLRVKRREKAAQEAAEGTAQTDQPQSTAPEAAQTQPVKPREGQQGTGTSTLKVTRPVKPPEAADESGLRTQTVRAGENEETPQAAKSADSADETQAAVPASESKTSTAPLKLEGKDKARAEAKKSDDDKDTIRIKPPSKVKTFAKPESGQEAASPRGGDSTAGGKGTGKITLKVKKKTADRTLSLDEEQAAKDTVHVPDQEPEETTEVPPEAAAPKGRKTLRLKGGTVGKGQPSAATVEQAVEESAGAPGAKAEPGIFMTIAAAATLIGVGVLVGFTVYHYLSLFTTAI